jgi:nitroreductase
MDAYHAIVTKRDTRDFTDEPVSEDDLHQLLQAARMAGSAKNSQANRLVVVTDADERAKLAECGKFADWVPRSPVVFVFVVPKDANRPFDIGRMAQNVMVAAHSMGLASCPVTFHEQQCVHDRLGIPDEFEAPMGVGVGHPAPPAEERKSAPRIPLDELVAWGRWKG